MWWCKGVEAWESWEAWGFNLRCLCGIHVKLVFRQLKLRLQWSNKLSKGSPSTEMYRSASSHGLEENPKCTVKVGQHAGSSPNDVKPEKGAQVEESRGREGRPVEERRTLQNIPVLHSTLRWELELKRRSHCWYSWNHLRRRAWRKSWKLEGEESKIERGSGNKKKT